MHITAVYVRVIFIVYTAFLDYDGVTVWGSPWDMAFQDSYLIRSKVGQIPGYTGFMTFQPELQLSMLFSSSISDLYYSTVVKIK